MKRKSNQKERKLYLVDQKTAGRNVTWEVFFSVGPLVRSTPKRDGEAVKAVFSCKCALRPRLILKRYSPSFLFFKINADSRT